MPYSKVIGNGRAKRTMKRFAHQFAHRKRKPNIALIGPASCGKTMFARLYSKSLDVPFIEIQPHTIDKMSDIYNLIVEKVGRRKLVDPCVIFVDECHNLSKYVEQGLLKAVEKSDCMLETEDNLLLFTSNISWVLATTEWGNMFAPFKTRFNRVSLRLYSKKELAAITELSYPGYGKQVAHYNMLPRECLSFAEQVKTHIDMTGDDTTSAMEQVADDLHIDKFGMSFKRIEILTELGQGPVAKSRLAGMIGVQPKELENDIIPPLLHKTQDNPQPMISVCSKGYYITFRGLVELMLREIPNLWQHAIPQRLWSRYPQFFEDNI